MPNVQKLEKATLNKLEGEGYAEVVHDENDIQQCTGMIRFGEEVPSELAQSFKDKAAVEFSGTLYNHQEDETSVETFMVNITEIEADAPHPTVRFMAQEDPYLDRDPLRRM